MQRGATAPTHSRLLKIKHFYARLISQAKFYPGCNLYGKFASPRHEDLQLPRLLYFDNYRIGVHRGSEIPKSKIKLAE